MPKEHFPQFQSCESSYFPDLELYPEEKLPSPTRALSEGSGTLEERLEQGWNEYLNGNYTPVEDVIEELKSE